MRMLYVCANLDAITGGGQAERTIRLCEALTRAGDECSVLTLDIGIDETRRAELGSTQLHLVPCLNRRFLVPRVATAELRRIIEAADVVHLVGHWTLLNALAYKAARSSRRPYIVSPAGSLGIVGRSRVLKRVYNRIIGSKIIRNACAHVAITEEETAEFDQYGVARVRVRVIPNGVMAPQTDHPDCVPFLRRHELVGRRLILFVGRLGYVKGPDLALEGFAEVAERIPAHDLVLAGPDNGMLQQLRRTAAGRGIAGRVHFLGHVGGDDRECAYRCSDFLVLPSRREAMSIVALEAGIRGRPVLFTAECGLSEFETAGGGRVVEGTARAIGEGILEFALSEEKTLQMGSALEAHVRTTYSWERAAEAYQGLSRSTRQWRRSADFGTPSNGPVS